MTRNVGTSSDIIRMVHRTQKTQGEREENQTVMAPTAGEIIDKAPMDKGTKLRIHFDDITHPAVATFLATIDSTRLLQNATKNVHQHLYEQHGKPPAVRSITLVIESMGGVAYTTGIPIDDLHKEIHLSLEYIAHKISEPLQFRHETIGVVVHEMVHCWQHNCKGTAPGGLIEGIADYVRLKSGLAPPHWKKTRKELGEKWDAGYQKTAWFLEWLEEKYGDGLISRMNSCMDGVGYEEKEFWDDLVGERVDSLWKKYLAEWDETNKEKEKEKEVEMKGTSDNAEKKAEAFIA